MNLMDDFRRDVIGILSKKVPRRVAEENLEKPPESIGSDLAFPCFPLAKKMKKKPAEIAKEISGKLKPSGLVSDISFYGPYINFYLDWKRTGSLLVSSILKLGDEYGRLKAKERVMVEYSAPNTNKPLHLGHLRNAALGMAVSNILEHAGCKVIRANLYNNRGLHICKSMVAYKKWGKGREPSTKGDHFVGRFYVLFEKKKTKSLEEEAKDMLKRWESGDKEVRALWKKMDSWAISGFRETYRRFGSMFDVEFRESDFWNKAEPIIKKGIKKGVFKKEKDGAIVADLEKHNLGKKAITRSDETSIYITNDLALTVHKFERYKLDSSVWVVGSEQDMYFRQLFKIFELLGYAWSERCRHLSYGLVFLPEGKMKSREGKVVDADDIIDEMQKLASKEIRKRDKAIGKKELESRSLQIGLAALKYFLLKVDAIKNIHFNPEESISFDGDTGPYIQYSHARACSILRKAGKHSMPKEYEFDNSREISLLKQIAEFPSVVERAARDLKPHYVAGYCLNLATRFNEFYESVAVLKASDAVRNARLALVKATANVLKNALFLLGIDAPERM